MGIFKALSSAIGGSMKDQWKEMFYCNAIPNDTLLVRGVKATSAQSANNGSDNVITDGSTICVADGQAGLVVCNGKVVSVFTEPGEYTFRSSKTAGVFSNTDAKTKASDIVSDIGRRFSYGGDAPIFYRVYYMNTKEILGSKVYIPSVAFRAIDENTGLDMDVTVSINCTYSIKIVDPMIIYANLIGNVEDRYKMGSLATQLNADVSAMVQNAFSRLSKDGLRVSGLPSLAPAISEAVKEAVNPILKEQRGIAIFSFPVAGIQVCEADMRDISTIQRDKVFTNPTMAGAHLVSAQADALRAAAKNKGL